MEIVTEFIEKFLPGVITTITIPFPWSPANHLGDAQEQTIQRALDLPCVMEGHLQGR